MSRVKSNSVEVDAALLQHLEYEFNKPQLLIEALTHPSLADARTRQQKRAAAYERLEFLGDRVLGLVIADWLFAQYPDATEGDLARRHAALVNRTTLKKIAQSFNLQKYLRVAGNDKAAERSNSVLSDAIEAVIGALYLDGGMETARSFIEKHWTSWIERQDLEAPQIDPKTSLQEWVQAKHLPLPKYQVISREGPSHAPHFVIELQVQGVESVRAEGTSKRVAEMIAAEAMLKAVSASGSKQSKVKRG